uniref:Uncharacterized protein n=1 Tax=Cucumis melo TaxID=3656 RepID=A0A9I9EIQ6_CUCME
MEGSHAPSGLCLAETGSKKEIFRILSGFRGKVPMPKRVWQRSRCPVEMTRQPVKKSKCLLLPEEIKRKERVMQLKSLVFQEDKVDRSSVNPSPSSIIIVPSSSQNIENLKPGDSSAFIAKIHFQLLKSSHLITPMNHSTAFIVRRLVGS